MFKNIRWLYGNTVRYPDYANRSTLIWYNSTELSVEISEDGFVSARYDSSAKLNDEAYLISQWFKINDIFIEQPYVALKSSGRMYSAMYPVKAGDVVSVAEDSGLGTAVVFFYPLR